MAVAVAAAAAAAAGGRTVAGQALPAWPEARTASLEGWGGDLTASATPGPFGCCGSGGAGHGLRRILSWASGCGGGMRGRLGRGGRDGLDTWLARVAAVLWLIPSLFSRPGGGESHREVFRRFREESCWRRIWRGSWECSAGPLETAPASLSLCWADG